MADRPEHQYVAILKGKKGEFDALSLLETSLRRRITPLVEIFTVPWDWEEDKPAKLLDAHLGGAVRQLERGWGNEKPIWLDSLWLDPDEQIGGTPALEYLFDAARDSLSAVPVGGPGRSQSHTASIASIQAVDGRGAVLRLDPEDLGDPVALTPAVDDWLRRVRLTPRQVDLIVDFSAITPALAPSVQLAATAVIPLLPHLLEWRTFTLASGAFPSDLSNVRRQSVDRLVRADWRLWNAVVSRRVPRLPAFGDYAIAHPELFDPDPRTIRPSATIRYTAEDVWVIVKERWTRYGFEQFHDASRTLMAQPEWQGDEHCRGCEFIDACAAGGSTGNLTTWRRVGTLHHMTLTAEQLASLS